MLAVGRSAYKHWVVRTKNLDANFTTSAIFLLWLWWFSSTSFHRDFHQLSKDLFHENPQTVNRKGVCSFRLPGFLILARCSLFLAAMLFFKSNCIYRLKKTWRIHQFEFKNVNNTGGCKTLFLALRREDVQFLMAKINLFWVTARSHSCHASVRLATSRLSERWRREGSSRSEQRKSRVTT